jgi:hypothetical protein
MELLLNLFWLTLALPAIWMWRRESVYAKSCPRFNRIRPFVLFGCVLMLLFPVVSATDDLHAMRQEMEESSPSKKLVKQAASDKSLTRLSTAGALPALVFPVAFGRDNTVCGQILLSPVRLPEQRRFGKLSSRAPPFSCLSMCVQFVA